MLEALRKSTSGIVAKILIGLLVLSFAVWGIEDVISGFSRSALVTVGDQEITSEEFQTSFRNEIDQLSEQAGQRIGQEQARAIGLDRQVLSRMIGSAAVQSYAEELNLSLSDQTLADGLKADPRFQDSAGNYSPDMLRGALRQIGLSEAGLLDLRRKDELREQITGALVNAVVVPKPYLDIVHQYREETRIIEHATIDAAKMVTVPEPTDTDLGETYEQFSNRFTTPELRRAAVLSLSVDTVAKNLTVPEADIKAAYEQTKTLYDVPEKRRIQQIAFKDKAAAEAAKAEIVSGKAFTVIAEQTGAKGTDIDLGVVTKNQLIDPKIADAAFALGKDVVSDVIEGRFATVLLRTTDITEGKESTFEETKSTVRDKLAREMATLEVQKLYEQVDDGRAAGRTLIEIAKDVSLPFRDVAAVSRTNTDAAGNEVFTEGNGASLAQAIFDAEVGVEREPIQLRDGGFAWVDALAITKPEKKPFDAVKDDVKALWIENKRTTMLSALAAKLVERLKSGEAFEKIAEEVGGKVEKTLGITRSTVPQGLTQSAIAQSFVLPQGGVSSALTADEKTRTLFRVAEVKQAPAPTKDASEKLTSELLRQFQGDQLAEYIEGLQSRVGVTINEAEFARATGAAVETGR